MNRYVRSGLITLGVVAAAAVIVAGFFAAGGGNDDVSLPPEIERVIPNAGSIIRPQDSVGADLIDTFTGAIQVNGQEIPLDQLEVVDPLGQVFFSPGETKDIQRFEPGSHSATVIYWPKSETRAAAESFTWQFRVG